MMATKAELQEKINKLETALQESELRYQSFVENHPYGVHENDVSGVVTFANQAYCDIFGFESPEKVIGMKIWDTLPTEEAKERLRQHLAYLVHEQPEPTADVNPALTQDGTPIVVRIDWDYLRDVDGNVTGFISVSADITEQKRAAEEREQLQQEVIEAQRRALEELSTPVIPVMDQILIMPLIGSIDSMRAKDIMRALLRGISRHRAQVVILDVTGVPIVDSGVANHLNKTVQAARLKGADTIVTGISDAVAETIVDLGIDWSDIETLSDLQTGLTAALDRTGLRLTSKEE